MQFAHSQPGLREHLRALLRALNRDPYRPTRISGGEAPALQPGQTFKVMTYNVQFMAGKDHLFFYDLPDFQGPETRPSRQSIEKTLNGIAELIQEEKPDLLLLQEVDDGARRTDYEDQAERLQRLLPGHYPDSASVYYWHVPFLPHPKVLGTFASKQMILSRYRIGSVTRDPLPDLPAPFWKRPFLARRSLLRISLPLVGSGELMVMNTHLEAFAEGTDVMMRQVQAIEGVLDRFGEDRPWVLGGDFNLLGEGQIERLAAHQRPYYNEQGELSRLTSRFPRIPTPDDLSGGERDEWTTYFSNDPALPAPDRTLDYLFHSPALERIDHYVCRGRALTLSDHLPVVATFRLG